MISYSRDPKQEISAAAVKIVGLGGAGANMLERIALDSIEGAQLLALNTDIRTLSASLAKEKVQLGINLTKGLGTGGDPELGQQAILEAEEEVRAALKNQKIVFLCAGLGGGTGSGAAPIVARIAREEGAFVVVFATMPFFFEGRRRREQAETSLNQLAVLSNALVTFDNNRMGELVLAKQGIHEAFGAADKMISESIKAVIRLVVRPGLIHVGLDELMTALRTTRSRCLFGSGIADGKDRASKALRNALSSPLLDQGALLKDAQSVLVHLSGGESLTLFEIELLMQSLQKHVPEHTQILFGAAIDSSMGDHLSITLISSLPEDALTTSSQDLNLYPAEKEQGESLPTPKPIKAVEPAPEESPEPKRPAIKLPTKIIPEVKQPKELEEIFSDLEIETAPSNSDPSPEPEVKPEEKTEETNQEIPNTEIDKNKEETLSPPSKEQSTPDKKPEDSERPFAEPELIQLEPSQKPEVSSASFSFGSKSETPRVEAMESDKPNEIDPSPAATTDNEDLEPKQEEAPTPASSEESAKPQLKLDAKHPGPQSELSFETAPRGRFEGEDPNVLDGEDLDLPPFLRKKKR